MDRIVSDLASFCVIYTYHRDYEPKGRGFESLPAYQHHQIGLCLFGGVFCVERNEKRTPRIFDCSLQKKTVSNKIETAFFLATLIFSALPLSIPLCFQILVRQNGKYDEKIIFLLLLICIRSMLNNIFSR